MESAKLLRRHYVNLLFVKTLYCMRAHLAQEGLGSEVAVAQGGEGLYGVPHSLYIYST